MKNAKKSLVLLLALFVLSLSAQTKSPEINIKNFINNIAKFNHLFPQEKVYLHFDNTGYYRNETIWFKAYVLKTDSNKYSDMSKVLYVELVSPEGDIIETRKLHIVDGQANGDIKLDKLLESGFYEVRAYTRYMTNWDKNAIFSRVFPIFNAPQKDGDYSKKVIDEVSYQKRMPDYREHDSVKVRKMNVNFYPEGGKLVEGLSSIVAFDATDENGAHLNTTGYLINDKDTVSEVSTIREGRGIFTYTPTEKPMTLMLKTEGGKYRPFTLPDAEKSGIVLTVNALLTQKITAEVSSTQDMAGKTLCFALTHNGNITACDTATVQNQPITRIFDKADMNEGVNQLTIFDSDGHILADRLIFINPHDIADTMSITTPNISLMPCKKVELNTTTIPKTTFSISVRDAATEVNGSSQDAKIWMLLSSDLKGFIENPYYYLESDDAVHRRAADLLMLVQGWRRYDIKMMMGKSPFKKDQPIEDYLYVDGKLHQAKKKFDVANVGMRVIMFDSKGYVLKGSTITDKNGYYAFKLPDCEGEWRMFIQTVKEDKVAKYYVGINRHFSPDKRHLSYYESQMTPLLTPKMRLKEVAQKDSFTSITNRNHLLRNVTVKGHRIFDNARQGWESEKRGAWRANIYYNCDDAADEFADKGEDVPSFRSWLAKRNTFFVGNETPEDANDKDTVHDSNNADEKHSFYNDGFAYKRRPIIWILNNTFYYATSVVKHIKSTDWEDGGGHEDFPIFLDETKSIYISEDDNVWTHSMLWSSLMAYHPVTVFVYTHHEFPITQKGVRSTHFNGYSKATTFEMNDYRMLPPQADFRRTLYWNPNVTTDDKGKAEIEFYNNSSCKQMIISAECITKDGRAIVYK